MLFPLAPQTPRCPVFELLNNEFLHFLETSIAAGNFAENLFKVYPDSNGNTVSVCWSNVPTRRKFHQLWEALPNEENERQRLFNTINRAQTVELFFNDTEVELPELQPAPLVQAIKSLTTHLFISTKELAGAKSQSNSSIEQHYQEFIQANGSSELCPICGTAALSQNRSGINDDDQWRADYDHVLCKDKYPIYSVHPGNFVPTCHICNSKAKGARNVLIGEDGQRRKAYYPLSLSQECCFQYARIEVSLRSTEQLMAGNWDRPVAIPSINFHTASEEEMGKIDVWKEIYKVPDRVQNQIANHFCERIASDLRPMDFHDFCIQLQRYASHLPQDFRSSEWRFWWHQVYEHLANQGQDTLEDIWSLINWKEQQVSNADMEATFS